MIYSLIFLWLIQTVAQSPIINCNLRSFFQIRKLTYIPVIDYNPKVNILFQTTGEVKYGTTEFSCSMDGKPTLYGTQSLCDIITCPIKPGVHNISIPVSSSYNDRILLCKYRWYSPFHEDLLCIQTNLTSDTYLL